MMLVNVTYLLRSKGKERNVEISRSRFIRAVVIAAAIIILFQGIKDSAGNYYDYDENSVYKACYASINLRNVGNCRRA